MVAAVVEVAKEKPSIEEACNYFENFLRGEPEVSKILFTNWLPWFCDQLFGYSTDPPATSKHFVNFPGGWMKLTNSSNNQSERKALDEFLKPTGAFIQTLISCEDGDSGNFLLEKSRLPEFVQRLLEKEKVQSNLWKEIPLYSRRLFKDKGGEYQVILSPLEYFLFSFARYPTMNSKNSKKSNLRSLFPSPWQKSHEKDILYPKVLCDYVDYFLGSEQTGKKPTVLQSRQFLDAFVEYWFIADDSKPFYNTKRSEIASPMKGLLTSSDKTNFQSSDSDAVNFTEKVHSAPSELLVNAATIFLRKALPHIEKGKNFERSPFKSTLTTPLFTFFRRIFDHWPCDKESLKLLPKAADLWITSLRPWQTDPPTSKMKFSSEWSEFVVDHYLLYNFVAMRFFTLCLKALPVERDAVLQAILTVVNFFAESSELLEFLKKLQAEYLKLLENGDVTDMRKFDLKTLSWVKSINDQMQEPFEEGPLPHEIMFKLEMPPTRLVVLRMFSADIPGGGSKILECCLRMSWGLSQNQKIEKRYKRELLQISKSIKSIFPSLTHVAAEIESNLGVTRPSSTPVAEDQSFSKWMNNPTVADALELTRASALNEIEILKDFVWFLQQLPSLFFGGEGSSSNWSWVISNYKSEEFIAGVLASSAILLLLGFYKYNY